MKFIYLILIIISVPLTSFSQTETTFIVDRDTNYRDLLEEIFENRQLEKLKIVVPENYDGYFILSKINYQYDYSGISVPFDFKVVKLSESLGNLKNLKELDVNHIGLEQLPSSITKLSALEKLDISFNLLSITNEIDKLRQLENLKSIKIYGNPLTRQEIVMLESLNLPEGIYYTMEDLANEPTRVDAKYFKPNRWNRLKQRLLEDINTYYPVGIYGNDVFAGYQELKAILTKKINTHLDGQIATPWKSLVAEWKHQASVEVAMDLGHNQFPSYELAGIISDEEVNGIRERKGITLCISLLTDHYTIYFNATLFLKNYLNPLGRPVTKKIYYGIENAKKEEEQLMQSLHKLTKKYFPDHEFIEHRLLFESHVHGATPHGQDPLGDKNSYPILNFLFNLEHIGDAEILE